MDQSAHSIWALHSLVFSGICALGLLLNRLDTHDAASGHWFPLHRLGSTLLWAFVASYALISTLILALMHDRLGIFLCYALALPMSLLLLFCVAKAVGELEPRTNKRRELPQEQDLAARLLLLSWSIKHDYPGQLHIRATVVSKRPIGIHLSALGTDADGLVLAESPAKPFAAEPQRLKPGHTRDLETVLALKDRRAPLLLVLLFDTWIETAPGRFGAYGLVSYHGETKRKELTGESCLHRPLPTPL